jgi:hypothetical protein
MTRLRAMAPLFVAAVLAAVAVATVEGAGCDDPGRYELNADGYELVGGCIAPGDLVVPEPAQEPPTTADLDTPAKS